MGADCDVVSVSVSVSADAAAAAAATSKSRKAGGGTGLNDLFIVIFGVAFLLSLSLNFLHSTGSIPHEHNTAIHQGLEDFKHKRPLKKGGASEALPQPQGGDYSPEAKQRYHPQAELHQREEQEDANNNEDHGDPPELHLGDPVLSTLNCDAFGGPPQESAQEMVWWADIPSDANFISPFYDPAVKRYMTFEPDGGGWNNIRMAMESVIGLAVSMGRTLVMPPQKKMYLLGKGDGHQKKHFGFVDFFPLEELAKEHVGLDIITMKEYLEQQAMTGQLKNKVTGVVEFPPGNRTDWDGGDPKEYDLLREWLRTVTYTPMWNPTQCLPAFPQSGDHKDVQVLQGMVRTINDRNQGDKKALGKLDGHPVPVDAPASQRLEESLSGRKHLCVYDEEMQAAPTLHFMCAHKLSMRLLVHFYAFLFFEDWKEDLWMKRFIRDHVRYIDEIQCAAGRLVHQIRQHARKRDPVGNPHGLFDTFHIRRGDFQYKVTRIDAAEIYKNSRDQLKENSTIYIATDERDKKFFEPLRAHYDLLFMDDFQTELQGVNTNYYGMIDQLVASRGRVFFGCFFSTFTGYINRIRGYHSVNDKAPGYEQGELPTTYYYAPIDRKFAMHEYSPLKGGFFSREYPTSWRDINQGIGMLRTALE